LRVSKSGDIDQDAIYLLERVDNGEPYHDPKHGDRNDPQTWWFKAQELKDKDA
jgi:hypothetical protein